MKLLLLDDDRETRTHVAQALEAAGHEVDACADGVEAVALGTGREYAVMILDRMVPRLDGLAALQRMRLMGVGTPALLLTAVDGVKDRVEGLEGGADDYLVKPFALSELVARVTVLARRQHPSYAQSVLRVGDLEMDLIKRSVRRAGRPVRLQTQEMKLLEYLMRHQGALVTRAMLLENVWSFHFDPQTNLIESHMSRLRAKLHRDDAPELIHTVRGLGYRLAEP